MATPRLGPLDQFRQRSARLRKMSAIASTIRTISLRARSQLGEVGNRMLPSFLSWTLSTPSFRSMLPLSKHAHRMRESSFPYSLSFGVLPKFQSKKPAAKGRVFATKSIIGGGLGPHGTYRQSVAPTPPMFAGPFRRFAAAPGKFAASPTASAVTAGSIDRSPRARGGRHGRHRPAPHAVFAGLSRGPRSCFLGVARQRNSVR